MTTAAAHRVQLARDIADLTRKCEAVADHFAYPKPLTPRDVQLNLDDAERRDRVIVNALNILYDAVIESNEIHVSPAPPPVAMGETSFAKGMPSAPAPDPRHGLRKVSADVQAQLKDGRELEWRDDAGLYACYVPGPPQTHESPGGAPITERPRTLAAFAEHYQGAYVWYTVESVQAMLDRGERVQPQAAL